jgi:flagellar motor protein MotB
MRSRARIWGWLLLATLVGCQNGPFASNPQGFQWQAGQQPAPQEQPYLAQLQELNRRVTQLDQNNRDLHMQLAQAQQGAQASGDQVKFLQKQLADTANQLRSAQLAKQDAEKRVDAIQASTRHRGGATISANNSIKSTLTPIDIPGLEVVQDVDVIRIVLPADQLFRQGSVQFQPGAAQTLDSVADAITRNYPRQMVGVEGHTDTPLSGAGPTAAHQLAAAQAYAVFEHLTNQNRMPAQQLTVMSQGANRPRYSNETAAGKAGNRRIELVIYPETIK